MITEQTYTIDTLGIINSLIARTIYTEDDVIDNNGALHDEKGRFTSKGGSKTYAEMCGTAYTRYSNRPAEAIEHLLNVKNGYVPNAIYKQNIGYIDFLWGKPYGKDTRGYGFAHIIEEREIQGFDGTALIKKLPEIIENGIIGEGKFGRKLIIHNDTVLILETGDSSNHWILTEYLLYDKMDNEKANRAMLLKKEANVKRKELYGR